MVLRHLQLALLLYKLIDLIVDQQDRIQQVAPGAALFMTWLFSGWAWLSGQPPVVITTIAFAIFAISFFLLTYIPWWLTKRFPRPFAVSADEMLKSSRSVQIVTKIFNRSQQNGIVLEFSAFLKAEGKLETWFRDVEERGIELNLGPQRSTTGVIVIHIFGTPYREDLNFDVWLRVIDRISGRWIKLKVPRSFPPDFFRVS